ISNLTEIIRDVVEILFKEEMTPHGEELDSHISRILYTSEFPNEKNPTWLGYKQNLFYDNISSPEGGTTGWNGPSKK
ncbi:15250_t:CDS:2, partial [Rhizophagus irregularis]